MIEIKEGSDEIIEFTLKDDSDSPIIIDDLEDLNIFISDEESLKATYRVSGATGNDRNINIINSLEGQINIVIDRDFTEKYCGKHFDLIIELTLDKTSTPGIFIDDKQTIIQEFEKYIKIDRVNK